MRSVYFKLPIFILVLATSACSIPHRPAEDYEQYLINNDEKSNFPTTDLEVDYVLTPNTVEHHLEFRSATVGYANVWIVEFGDMLETTLQSEDVQEAFSRLTRQPEGNSADNLITFDLVDYQFVDYGAHIILEISVDENGTEIFRRKYDEDGKTQGGKMFWGGVFAMKNAIQQSTKLAVDEIITDFINDYNSKNPNSE